MSALSAVFRRELKNYFVTPIGYVFMGVFLLIAGVYFTIINLSYAICDLSVLFSQLTFLFMLLVPLLTMRLLSEEKKTKTERLLLSAPIPIWSFVVGKFLAACMVLVLTLIGTLFFVLIIAFYGQAYPALIVSNYLGFLLIGVCYIALGVLISALTESQLSAAVLSFGANLLLLIAESALPSLNVPLMPWLPNLLSWLSIYQRYDAFMSGIISPASILYYLSFAAVLLFIAVRSIDRRRWEG